MLSIVSESLLEHGHLGEEPLLLVGVSGGPDSLCLLDLLHRLGYALVVAHVDHQLRLESGQEAEVVAAAASARGLQYIHTQVDVTKFAEVNAMSLEEAARKLRYRFLFDQARQINADAVVVGHTAEDQVETVLMHLFKGAGLAGLRGMHFRALPNEWSDTIPLLRPLLSIWREEILEYCRQHALQPVLDQSNLDTRFERNRIRQEILPYLEGFYPGLRRRLNQMAGILEAEDEILHHASERAWKLCLLNHGVDFVALEVKAFQAQPVGVQRRLVRKAAAQLLVNPQDIDFATVEKTLQFIEKPPRSNRSDLAAGLQLILEGTTLWIAAWNADLPQSNWPALSRSGAQEALFRLDLPGELYLSGGWHLRSEIIHEVNEARQQASQNQDPYQTWIDTAGLQTPLYVRTRREGDRFQVLGMDGHSIKITDLMVNVKIPLRARATWPLVCSGTEIIWVPGVRSGHLFRLTSNTRQAAHLTLSFEI